MKYKLILAMTSFLLLVGLYLVYGMVDGSLRNEKLTDMQLASIVGGDSCKECKFDPRRKDECYHDGFMDPCSTTECFANYLIEDTCVSGTGTCNSYYNTNKVHLVQYRRKDTNCTTSYPYGLTLWITHYYGPYCVRIDHYVRCQKSQNNCNGDLISMATQLGGIACQY